MKKTAERPNGKAKPRPPRTARQTKRLTFHLKDDGFVPNNSGLPLVFYRSAVQLDGASDPAAVYEAVFQSNGWGDTWRDSIYDFVHYHPSIHEVLGIVRGHASVSCAVTLWSSLVGHPGGN